MTVKSWNSRGVASVLFHKFAADWRGIFVSAEARRRMATWLVVGEEEQRRMARRDPSYMRRISETGH